MIAREFLMNLLNVNEHNVELNMINFNLVFFIKVTVGKLDPKKFTNIILF